MSTFLRSSLIIALTGFAAPLMAQGLPDCGASGETSTSNEQLEDGYPRQQNIAAAEIVVGRSDPCLDTYTFRTRDLDYVVPNAEVSVSGLWVRVGEHRVARNNAVSDEYGYSNSLGISEEIATEASIGLAASVTAGVSFFGLVGAEATVEASVGLALSIAKGTETSQEWSHTTEVNPGEEVQLWSRAMRVHAEWTPKAYDYRTNPQDPFVAAQAFVAEVYLPSYKAFLLRNDMTEKEADAVTGTIGLSLVGNWPPQNAIDATYTANALNLLNDFLDDFGDGFTSVVLLPYKEVYTSRYRF